MTPMGSMRRGAALLLASLPALLLPLASATAAPYSSVVVYGDSLSDNGNFFAATGVPGAPYFGGRRSDGPVAVEYLASSLGVPLLDFAWIGATTGDGNFGDGGTVTTPGAGPLPGMTTVFDATKAGLGPYVADGLFVVWGGPNDILAPSPLDATPGDIISRAVGNLVAITSELQALGARHILVPGMPDLGLTPFFRSIGQAAEGTAFTNAFNFALQAFLPADVLYFDTASLFRSVVADPTAFGFANVTEPCFDKVATVCANPGEYLFFDDFHPTTATHALLAGRFAAAVGVPEPGTVALMCIALAGLGVSRRAASRSAGRTRQAAR
jgi:cholinesterase